MLRSIKLAPLAIIGALAVVLTLTWAQAPIDLAYTPAQVGSVVVGGGDGTITFAGNSSDSPSWTYAVPVAGAPGREAWLVW